MELELLDKKITEAVKKYITCNTPGMALLIGEKGKIVYHKGFGLADFEKKEYITPDNTFFIASISKQFTTMAVMMLKEKGLVDYDETIERFFPDFPSYVKKVTVRHLMTHTSGIKEYFDDKFCQKAAEMGDRMTQSAILDVIKGFGDLEFEPETRFSYCNSAYVMLGAIVEKLSGMTFAEYIEKNIFKPLGMKNSVVGVSSKQKIDKLAVGYKLTEGGAFEKTPYDMSTIGWADGNIISTVEDLFIWHNALYTEKLVKKETLEEALTSYILKDGTPTGYGFGHFLNKRRGLREIWHTGGTIGYISRFSRFVEEDVAVIMLTNYMGVKRDEVFGEIVDIYLNSRQSPLRYIDVPYEELKAKTGKYKDEEFYCDILLDASGKKLKICCDLGRLKGEYTLSPVGKLLFRLDTPADYYISFLKTDSSISGIELSFNGLPMRLQKA